MLDWIQGSVCFLERRIYSTPRWLRLDAWRSSGHDLKLVLFRDLKFIPQSFITLFLPAVDCGRLAIPEHGFAHGNSTTYPNTITFSCSTGFSLHGTSSRTCQADGTWTSGKTRCQGTVFSFSSVYHSFSKYRTCIVF